MADTRTVTVSITINLGNYENLRLEVSDIAETKEDAENLRHFLADVLDGYGNNDATAKHAIETYKERILADANAEPEVEMEYEVPFAYSVDLMKDATEEVVTPPEPSVAEEPAAEESDSVSVPQTEPSEIAEFVCSKCGAPVTKLQRDVSMLFNHKILCKDCMK